MVRGGLPPVVWRWDAPSLTTLFNQNWWYSGAYLLLLLHWGMSKFGKQTLYLDLESVTRIRAALERLPGKPSVSSFVNEHLPAMADQLERMVDLLTSPAASLESVRSGLDAIMDDTLAFALQVKKDMREDVPPKESVLDVPPSKLKRQKKLA